ncbi:MAG: prolyl-tRNA synthetase associated domain-containing protein [Deltaproteobacteria bacterium]|nr:prolyl-tRNA synthetase associated domain-containing protein [Deltaproteobacteria bacterium]MBW2069869.1 prolyl-tRNA synthetase associated domain-containing protein [Deltaproteobacteria bacterium]
MIDLYQFLDKHAIKYQRHDHPPVYTVEDVKRLVQPLPGARSKNLFLRDHKGRRHFLLIVPADKRVHLKALAGRLGTSRLSFGSPERLKKYLGVDSGAVSIFAIINDRQGAVEVIMDENLWESETFQFHPLVNTTTLLISRQDLQRFVDLTGHQIKKLQVPSRD